MASFKHLKDIHGGGGDVLYLPVQMGKVRDRESQLDLRKALKEIFVQISLGCLVKK